MVANVGGTRIEWIKGSHTANIYTIRGNVDCFTFAFEKNKTTQLDFTSALESYLMGA